ncbi:MAG: hypothetical protein IJ660_01000 [Alphaproteobacteria bacterium]|nr:hypothetical protein [Alphaproteobacteria bacterium]
MTKALKFIENSQKYIPYDLPDGASLYEEDFNTEVSCCSSGKKIKFNDSYTSRHIHTEDGIGYAECETCYFGEHNER